MKSSYALANAINGRSFGTKKILFKFGNEIFLFRRSIIYIYVMDGRNVCNNI